jgi:hypothetical protein
MTIISVTTAKDSTDDGWIVFIIQKMVAVSDIRDLEPSRGN